MDINNIFSDKKNLFIGIVLFLSVVSFFHITHFWSITNSNPFDYISGVAAELFIVAALIAIKYTNWGWVMFLIGLFIQGFGNIYSSFTNIDMNSSMFLSFVSLTKPVYNLFTDNSDNIIYARSLSVLTGLFYVIGTTTCFNTYKAILNQEAEEAEYATDEIINTPVDNEELTVLKSHINKSLEAIDKKFEDLQNTANSNNQEILNLIKDMKTTKVKKLPIEKKEEDNFTNLVEPIFEEIPNEPINNLEISTIFDDEVVLNKEEVLNTQLLQTIIEENNNETEKIVEDYNKTNIYIEQPNKNPYGKNHKWDLKDS